MSKKAQVCVACGAEKGKDDFERFDGGKVWSPTCLQCAAEQAKLRERADHERQRRAAEESEARRQERLRQLRAEKESRDEEPIFDPIPEAPPPVPATPVAEEASPGSADVVEAVRRVERALKSLHEDIRRWEFHHHPIRTIAYGLIAWSVLASLLGLIAILAWALILGGGGLQTQGATAANVGLLVALLGFGVLVGLSIWMARLLKR